MTKTRRLALETLEKRFVLSGLSLIDSEPLLVDYPLGEETQCVLVADESVCTSVQLVDGQTVLLSVAPKDLFGDLTGVEFELLRGTGPPTPRVAGVIMQGEYTLDEGLSILGRGQLLSHFEVADRTIDVTLTGGSLGVEVQQNAFKQATFARVDVTLDVTDPNAPSPLKLKATLHNGSYKPGEGVTFNARLEVTEDFVYKKSPVKATLKAGGFVQADVQSSDLKRVTFGGIEVLAGDVDILMPDGTSLKLTGSLQGKYENGLIDLDCELDLREEFVYTKPAFVARLISGDVSVKVEKSEFKSAELTVKGEVDINIPNTDGLKLSGTLEGKYENDQIDLSGGLTLRSDFEYSRRRISTRISAGELAPVRIHGGDVVADLTGAAMESTVRRRATPLVFEGTVQSGMVRNGRLYLKAHAELRSPTVLASRGRFTLKLVKADLDLLILDGRLAKFRLSDLKFHVCR